uniref:hypothetical protein n=1 Tax=Microcystis aeruginosa TaxID=1126 RepID=UPI0005642580
LFSKPYLEQTLEQEAAEKIANNAHKQEEINQKIENYSQAINSLNTCLTAMGLQKNHLPVIGEQELGLAEKVIEKYRSLNQ